MSKRQRCVGCGESDIDILSVKCPGCGSPNNLTVVRKTPAMTAPSRLEDALRALLSWSSLRDMGLQMINPDAALVLIRAAAQLGRTAEREACVQEATVDWPQGTHWPYASDDPRGKCSYAAGRTAGRAEAFEEAAKLCWEDDGVMPIQRNGIEIYNAIRNAARAASGEQ